MSWSEPAHVVYRLDAKLVWGYQSGAWQPAALIATTPRPTFLAWQENKCFLQAYPFGIIMYNYN